MNTKHTKGPWYVNYNPFYIDVKNEERDSKILNINLHLFEPPKVVDVSLIEENKYNAALIAVSPEMLEILSELISDLEEINLPTSINDTINRAKSLIAKATTI